MVGIYKIQNIINNKVYIGQSINIRRRWNRHKQDSFNENSSNYDCLLYRAFRKYGIDSFDFTIIEECLTSELNTREIFWIEHFKSFKEGYNMTIGGHHSTPIALSFEDAEEIIQLLIDSEMTQGEIGSLFNISQRMVSAINIGQCWKRDNISYPIRVSAPIMKNKLCPDCGVPILLTSSYCTNCIHIHQRKIDRPNRAVLKSEIRIYSFAELGRKYNISDNAIRKWCKNYNLPSTKKEIKSYSDEQWSEI